MTLGLQRLYWPRPGWRNRAGLSPAGRRAMEPVVRVSVVVTFLRMDRAPAERAPALPPTHSVVRLQAPTVPYYRFLYNTVGADYVWWLRRTMADRELADLLRDPMLS